VDSLFGTSGLIEWGGFLIIALLVFAETGLLLGLVLPGGETLTFTAGLLVSTNSLDISIFVLLPALICISVAGDACGFFIGRKLGERLCKKEDTWYFKKKYLDAAEKYLQKHCRFALIMGKFLPVIRPFTPVVSGAAKFTFPRFITLSAIACTLYMSAFVLAGYFLGYQFPQIKDYLGWIFPVSIAVAIGVGIHQFRKLQKED
jgi:membrane-associated protein